MSGDDETVRIKKISATLPVSTELLVPQWVTEGMFRWIFGPDSRTEAEKEQARRDAEVWRAEQQRQQDEVLREHAERLAASGGLRRAILELHAPVVSDYSYTPRCEGCDMDGYDAEPPPFPCRSYELARDFGGAA